MTEEQVIPTDQEDEIVSKALVLREALGKIAKINSPEDMNVVSAHFLAAKSGMKMVKAHLKPLIDEANSRHKKLTGIRSKWLKPYEDISADATALIAEYDQEQERIQREEQARLAEVARKQAEEAMLREADELEKAGHKEEAEAVLEAPIIAPPPPVQKAEKPKGVSTSKRWRAEVYDKMALVQAIAAGDVPLTLVDPNMTALNQMAVALNDQMQIAGVKAMAKTVVSGRTA